MAGATIAILANAAITAAGNLAGLVLPKVGVWTAAAIGGGLGALQYLLRERRSDPDATGQSPNTRVETFASGPARWVLGRSKVGGVVVFWGERHDVDLSTAPRDDTKADDLHLAIAVSEGECDAVEAVIVGNDYFPVVFQSKDDPNLPAKDGTKAAYWNRSSTDNSLSLLPQIEGAWWDASARPRIRGAKRRSGYTSPGHQQGAWRRTSIDRPYDPNGEILGRHLWPNNPPDQDFENEAWLERMDEHDETIRKSELANAIGVWPHLEADGSTSTELHNLFRTAEPPWGDEHKLEGVAWIHVRLRQPDTTIFDDKVFRSGVPRIQFVIRGVKIDYPGATGPTWTENAAAVRWWWHTFRRGIPPSAIDRADFDRAFRICDEESKLPIPTDDSDRPEWATEADPENLLTFKKYTINGVLSSGDDPPKIEEEFDDAWQGFVVEEGGVLHYLPGAPRAAEPVPILSRDIVDIIGYKPAPSLAERINAATLTLEQSRMHEYESHALREIFDESKRGSTDPGDPGIDQGVHLPRNLGSWRWTNHPAAGWMLANIALRRARNLATWTLRLMPGRSDDIVVSTHALNLRGASSSTTFTVKLARDPLSSVDIRIEPDDDIAPLVTLSTRTITTSDTSSTTVTVSSFSGATDIDGSIVLSADGLESTRIEIRCDSDTDGNPALDALVYDPATEWIDMSVGRIYRLRIPEERVDERVVLLEKTINDDLTVDVVLQAQAVDAFDIAYELPDIVRRPPALPPVGTRPTGPPAVVGAIAEASTFSTDDGAIKHRISVRWTASQFDTGLAVFVDSTGDEIERTTITGTEFVFEVDRPAAEYRIELWHFDGAGRRSTPVYLSVVPDWSRAGDALPAPTWLKVITYGADARLIFSPIENARLSGLVSGVEVRYRRKSIETTDDFDPVDDSDWDSLHLLETEPIQIVRGLRMTIAATFDLTGRYALFARHVTRIASPIAPVLRGPISASREILIRIPERSVISGEESPAWASTNSRHLARFVERSIDAPARGQSLLMIDRGTTAIAREAWDGYDSSSVERAWPFGRCEGYGLAFGSSTIPHRTGTGLPDPTTGTGTWYLTESIDVGTARRIEVRAEVFSFAPESDIQSDLTFPIASTIDDQDWKTNTAVSITLPVATNAPAGAVITYALVGLPIGLTFTPSTRTISGTPVTVSSGEAVYSASDTAGGTATLTFDWSVAGTVTAPAVPTDLSISNITSTGASVSWSAALRASQYQYRYQAGTGAWSSIQTTTSRSIDLTGLASNTQHTVQIRSKNPGGESGWAQTSFTTLAALTAPGVPAGLSVVASTDSLSVSWTSEPGAVTYEVRWKSSSSASFPAANLQTGLASNTASITGLTASTGFDVQVQSRNEAGASGWSSSVSRTTGSDVLTAPSVSVDATDASGIVVTFTAVTGATTYQLQVQEDPDESGNAFTSNAWADVQTNSSTTKTVEGTFHGYLYRYRCRVWVNDRYSPWTTGQVVRGGVPLPPSVTVGTRTASSIAISWPSVSGATAYGIEYRKSGEDDWTGPTDTTSTSYTITGLDASSSYEIRTRSKNGNGYSRYPNVLSALTIAPTVTLGQLTGLTASAVDHDTIRVSWNAVTGVSWYSLVFRIGGVLQANQILGASDTTADWDGAMPGTTYTVGLSAVRGTTERAASVTVTTPAAPTNPYTMSAPTLTSTGTSIEVDFRAKAGSWLTRFDIRYRRKGRSSWNTVTLTNSNSSTGTYDFERILTGLTSNRIYEVQVRGVVGTAAEGYSVGVGNWTSTREVSTKLTAPSKVTGITRASRNAGQISITWSASTNAAGYRVEAATRTGSWYTVTSSTTSRFRQINFSNAGTYYRIRVRAFNDAGNGPWSDVFFDHTAWPVIGTMGAITPGVSSGNVTLDWSDVWGATGGYEIKRGSTVLASSHASSFYTASGLPAVGSSWTFSIRAVQRQDRWSTPTTPATTRYLYSNTQTVTVSRLNSSPAANHPSVSNLTSTSFKVRWTIPTGVSTGQLEVRRHSDSVLIRSIAATNSGNALIGVTVTGLQPGTRYTVRLRWQAFGASWGAWAVTGPFWTRAAGSSSMTEPSISVSSEAGVYEASVEWERPTGFVEGDRYDVEFQYRERGRDWIPASSETTTESVDFTIDRVPPLDLRARVRSTGWSDWFRKVFFDESARLSIGHEFLNESSLPTGYRAGVSSRSNSVPLQGFPTAAASSVDFTGRLFAVGSGVQLHLRWEPASTRQAMPVSLLTSGLTTSMYLLDSDGRILYSGRSMTVDFQVRAIYYFRIVFDGLTAATGASDDQAFRLKFGTASTEGGAIGALAIANDPIDPVDLAASPPTFTGEISDFVVEESVSMTAIDLPTIAGGRPPYTVQAFGLPAGVSLTDGQIVGTPTDTAPAMGVAEFVAVDAAGGFDQRLVRWTVAMDIPVGGFTGFGRIDNPFQIPCALVDNVRNLLFYSGATNAAAIAADASGARSACTWFRCPTTYAHRALIRGAANPDYDLVVKVGNDFLTSETTDDVEWVDAPGSSDGAIIGIFRYASTTTSTGANNSGDPLILEWSPEVLPVIEEASGAGGATNRRQAGLGEAGGTAAPPGETITDIYVYHRSSETGAWSRNPTALSSGDWSEAHPTGANVKQVRFLAHFRRWSNRAVRRFSHFVRDREA